MRKTELVELLKDLSLGVPDHSPLTFYQEAFKEKCKNLHDKLPLFNDLQSHLQNITSHYFSDTDHLEWQYLVANFYVVQQIGEVLKSSGDVELLSVKEMKEVKACLESILKIGVNSKLLPKLPCHVNEVYTETNDIFYQYHVLKCSILAFIGFLNNDHLKPLILPDCLKSILSGLYQIAYCHVKKDVLTSNYDLLLKDQQLAVNMLGNLSSNVHSTIYIKETMIIFQQTAPPWFKKRVAQALTKKLLSPKGIENVTAAMLDGTPNDNTKTWRILDVIFKLIASSMASPECRDNVCEQVAGLIDSRDDTSLVLERLFVICLKKIYAMDGELVRNVFIKKLFIGLVSFTFKDNSIVKNGPCTWHIVKCIRLIHAVFIQDSVESHCLPIDLLKPLLQVIFKIFLVTEDTVFKATHKEAKSLLVKFLNSCTTADDELFDSFVFGIISPEGILLPLRADLTLEVEGVEIVAKTTKVVGEGESLLRLLQGDISLSTRYFKYLLMCLVQREKYFNKSEADPLCMRQMLVLNDIATLAESKEIQKEVIERPMQIVVYIRKVLKESIDHNIHRTVDFESDQFQTLFTAVMILSTLTENYDKKRLAMFKLLQEDLSKISLETNHKELADLSKNAVFNIGDKELGVDQEDSNQGIVKSQLDLILEDICDPLLPVRGHGLLALKKLVENKDKTVLDKKQFIITIFQQNLTHEDSFIYLNAIDGLATMCNLFTDTVIKVLCEEFSDFRRTGDDRNEIRMKVGETLVRVSRSLGEMAPKYKALLLNTFLFGTKDDDHLVRASSLSNLGEICRVLGYRLSTMVTEILVCVNAIILSDKAIEPKRAAVTVIRQLLAGLETEMIVFLKEDILPIYRMLKQIYDDDKDDVMRLQAQLALEELNENMNDFIFPKPQIHTEKKIILLD